MLGEMKKQNLLVIVISCVLLTSVIFPGKLQADAVTEEWVAIYDGPSNSAGDMANGVAVDTLGNVYVTGGSYGDGTSSDYATIKYNADGTVAWVARYDYRGYYDYAYDLAVDASGNVYVTGTSAINNSGIWEYATIKYNPDGQVDWLARYDSPEDGTDHARAISLDASGNVYVTGFCYGGSAVGRDYVTIKYDSSGNQLWVAQYNGPGNGDDSTKDMALDADGNVYVTGQSYSGTQDDYATIKYDSSGNEIWVARYDGSGDGDDHPYAMAVDSGGNVYVTGQSYGSDTKKIDYATIKYNTDGTLAWEARYNAENYNDVARAIALDTAGNVYVTGGSFDNTGGDYATIKYNNVDGTVAWIARYDYSGGYDGANAMAVDASGNIYVTGVSSTDSTHNGDYATVKYDTNGNELWVTRYANPENEQDTPTAITVDASANVYVTGRSNSLTDYATIKYSQTLPNEPPVADAGPDQALLELGTTVNLDGDQSYDLEGDPITYCWTMIEMPLGSAAALSNPASAWPSFVADVYGDYVIELVVSDPWNPSDPDTVTVSFDNVKPVADAGDNQAVIVGDTVNLNGSGSDDINGDNITFSWTFESVPAGSSAVLFDACTVTPSFVADEAGTYFVSLIVNDGLLDSDVATVSIEVISRYNATVQILLEFIDQVNLLPEASLKNKNLKNALTNKINEVLAMVDEGLYVDARDKLQNDIVCKTNGCAATGEPDKNDWITTCPEQSQVYPLVIQAIELLEELI